MNRLQAWRNRRKPRCAAPPPWKLPDAAPCCCPRGHEHTDRDDRDWHADGRGFIWNDVLGQWRWMGPVVDLAEEYADHESPSGAYQAVFTEEFTSE